MIACVVCALQVFTMLSQAAQHEDCSPEIRTTLERVIVSEHTA